MEFDKHILPFDSFLGSIGRLDPHKELSEIVAIKEREDMGRKDENRRIMKLCERL